MTALAADTLIGIDDEDGLPTWLLAEGEPVVAGHHALDRLGVGHRCETWLCWSTALWCPVVVKLPRPHQADHPRARRSLRREAAALAVLGGHPATPRLLVDATAADLPYVVTDYLDGPSLADLVDTAGALEPVECALLASALLPALRMLHVAGLAHLDVKPENVVVRDGVPMLLDFGSVREIGAPQPAGHPVGTPGYAAPEMEACRPISAAMDLFGLGATMAEALTGEPYGPATEVPDSIVAPLVHRLLDDDPGRRGTTDGVLGALARAVPEALRPWPAWADPLSRPGAGSR